ncbi:hypothetical protein T492DRAFT_974458 [Pavlovales sp. CCMP2436]|nr:hypothetical protein T492DRAFT_974458 [Pavlovales sp. CCMP2436]
MSAVRLLTTEQLVALGAERGVVRATIKGATRRELLVVQAGSASSFFCLDMRCHHHGASLADGAIVDIEDAPHIVCPAHGRYIKLSTGELVDEGIDSLTGSRCPVSHGAVQRMHACELRPDGIWAHINNLGDLQSDRYNNIPSLSSAAPAQPGAIAGRLSTAWQARKARATEAVSSKLAAAYQQLAAPQLLPASASLESEEEEVIDLTPPQQPELPRVQAPASRKRTINDYFGRADGPRVQRSLLPGTSADDAMNLG